MYVLSHKGKSKPREQWAPYQVVQSVRLRWVHDVCFDRVTYCTIVDRSHKRSNYELAVRVRLSLVVFSLCNSIRLMRSNLFLVHPRRSLHNQDARNIRERARDLTSEINRYQFIPDRSVERAFLRSINRFALSCGLI